MKQMSYEEFQYKNALRVFRVLNDKQPYPEQWCDDYDEMMKDIETNYRAAAQQTRALRRKQVLGGYSWWTWKRSQVLFARGRTPLVIKIGRHIANRYIEF